MTNLRISKRAYLMLIASSMTFIASSCLPSQSPPVPKGGYNTVKVNYDKAHPEAYVIKLPDIRLSESAEEPQSLGSLGDVTMGMLVAFESTIVHPDDRFEACALVIRLSRTLYQGEEKAIIESAKVARGSNGKLKFRAEIRIPRLEPGNCEVTIHVDTFPPGMDPKDPPKPWQLDAAKGQITLKATN